jgi:hypothetical protein
MQNVPGSSRKRDLNTVAASIVRQATDQEPVRRPARPDDKQTGTEQPKKPKG